MESQHKPLAPLQWLQHSRFVTEVLISYKYGVKFWAADSQSAQTNLPASEASTSCYWCAKQQRFFSCPSEVLQEACESFKGRAVLAPVARSMLPARESPASLRTKVCHLCAPVKLNLKYPCGWLPAWIKAAWTSNSQPHKTVCTSQLT